ncbi:sugar phosphate isomerase/epimerase [bacterium]|nr:sugar phosphate isomerase/epimerase [bacterium]
MIEFPNSSMPQWTAEEINARLGISTAIYQKSQLSARHIAEIRESGITRIELSIITGSLDHRNCRQVTEILNECQKQSVTVVGVHGPFKLPYNSEDEEERKIVVRESLSAIRFAEEAGASIYVAHFGCGKNSKETVMELLNQIDGFRIKLTTENGRDLQDYMAVVDDIGSDRFGITVDIGHTIDSDGINPFVKKENARQTLAQCGNRVFHIHLHEIFNLEQKADHRPPLHQDGIAEWGEIFAALKEINYRREFVFEDGRGENPEEWIQMTAAFPKAFVKRYGNDK